MRLRRSEGGGRSSGDGTLALRYRMRLMADQRGKFVVLEGIDGSGTTTHVARLADRLRREKVLVRTTREPSDGPIGTLVGKYSRGASSSPGGARRTGRRWRCCSRPTAWITSRRRSTLINQGGVLISDRYDASSLAYQSVSSGRGGSKRSSGSARSTVLARPDLTIVLDVNFEEAARRRDQRGEPAQLYEQNEVQRALAVFYRDLAKHLPKDRIVLVDAGGTIDEVHERIYAAYAGFAGTT